MKLAEDAENHEPHNWASFVYISILLMAVVFLIDLITPLGVAVPMLYALPILISIWAYRPKFTFAIGLISVPLIIIGYFNILSMFPSQPDAEVIGIMNRIISLLAIWIAVLLAYIIMLREGELKASHDALEERVMERTKELALTNDAMKMEILERKRVKKNLMVEKNKLAVTLKSIGDGVIVTDLESRVTMVNTAAEKMIGWEQEEALGRPIDEVFKIVTYGDGESQDNPAKTTLKTGSVASLPTQTILIAKDGTERRIDDSGAPIHTENGEIIGAVLVFRDITKQVKMEEDIANINRLESIGELAGGIAHDFNNILTVIQGNISMAEIRSTSDGIGEGMLENAAKACERAKGLANQLLTFSKGGEPVREITDIANLLYDSSNLALSGSKVRAIIDVPADTWPAEVDKSQINEVLHNLLINAKEAMPGGGIVHVTDENLFLTENNDYALPGGKYVKISIEDEGVGIPEENLSNIFDPYFTTKSKGRGFGLAIAFSVVRRHGGYIGVVSEVGKGSTFDMVLPASEEKLPPEVPSSPIIVKGKGRILWMDDEEMILDLAKEIISSLGYEGEFVADGRGAIGSYEEALEVGQPYDAVMLDLTIPGGMGGLETLAELKKLDPTVKCVVCSGYSSDPAMSNFRDQGFVGVLSKPFTISELSQTLEKVTNS